jgi:hypothetical protein
VPAQAAEEGDVRPVSQHAEIDVSAASASAARHGTEAAPENVLQELFSGIWLAEDGDGAAEARNGPARTSGGPDERTGAAAPGRHSVLDQLAALPEAADVPGGVADSIADGKY